VWENTYRDNWEGWHMARKMLTRYEGWLSYHDELRPYINWIDQGKDLPRLSVVTTYPNPRIGTLKTQGRNVPVLSHTTSKDGDHHRIHLRTRLCPGTWPSYVNEKFNATLTIGNQQWEGPWRAYEDYDTPYSNTIQLDPPTQKALGIEHPSQPT